MDLCIGTSGWAYAGWRGRFYPRGLARARELAFASRRLNSIEINGTFYSLQRPSSFRRWFDETPPGFLFAVKGSRFITHMKKLDDVETPLANFFASGLLLLREKLGPVLWQIPPNLAFDRDRVARFLALLPKTTTAAARLARRHDHRLDGRDWTRTDRDRPIRHALEVRHPSFLCAEFAALLHAHGAALVFADTAGLFPYAEQLTADFVYIRLHGAEAIYASGYTDAQLDWWAARIRAWQRGREPRDARRIAGAPRPPRRLRDVYVYFDNDALGHAPFDALRLAGRLGVAAPGGREPAPRRASGRAAHGPPGARRRSA
ncbi:MAG TPA: DUF72 domain-containing protein [Longimicrobiales bacterium]